MSSARPPNAAAGKPPPITLPKVIRSGATPSIPYRPDAVTRKPVITSSLMNSAPCSWHRSARNVLKPTPSSTPGGTTPMLPAAASVITAAIWSP